MEKYEIHFVGSVLDSNTSGDEQAKIVALIEQGHSVALDLSGCSYVSSAGLRVMLYAFKLAKAKSRDVCLVGVSHRPSSLTDAPATHLTVLLPSA